MLKKCSITTVCIPKIEPSSALLKCTLTQKQEEKKSVPFGKQTFSSEAVQECCLDWFWLMNLWLRLFNLYKFSPLILRNSKACFTGNNYIAVSSA